MRERPNIEEILKNKQEQVTSGTRNPQNVLNSDFFFQNDLKTFLNFVFEAGIGSNFANISQKNTIKFKSNTPVTRFLALKSEDGTLDLTNSGYVFSYLSSHFNDFVTPASSENGDFIEYVEEIIET